MTSRQRLIAAVICCTVTLSSCAAINVDALPQPGRSYSGGRDIVIEFENALNLPARARVVLDGTNVGVVTKVEPTARHVDVTATIDPHVTVPSNIHAALQQATVLGDIYVALERSQNDNPAAPALGAGGRISLAQTTTPPPLEATIANLANFVSSGSIQRIQNTMIGLDRVQPAGGEAALRKLVSQVSADVEDLGKNVNTVDQWLSGLSQTAQLMHDRIPSFLYWFGPTGMAGFGRGLALGIHFGRLFPSLGSIYAGGYWLMPLLRSLVDGFGALQHSKWVFENEYPAWQRLLTTFFLPQDKYPAINITSILGPDGRELSGRAQDVLRILGAAP
ncbi:MAG: MlaD family protein [Mycobacterium sp.]|uniref:MlaD family protein n=1 Tax=Mycobacterium sp. TaxID=1785 RepID=UPI003C3562A1